MAKTNAPRGRTRQSRRLNPDVLEEEQSATSEDQAKDEPENTKPVVEDKPQTEEANNESVLIDQKETGDAELQAESDGPDAKPEEDKPDTRDAKGESDSSELKLAAQDRSDSTEDTPVEDKSEEDTPVEDTPAEDKPAEDTSAVDKSVEDKSAEGTPAEDTSAVDKSVEDTPVEGTPAEGTPMEGTPVEDTPVEDTPVEDTPAEHKPVVDTPEEDKSAEDTPMEDTLVEDKPVEDTPVEDTPMEDTLVEHKPVEDTPEEDKSAEDTPMEDKPVEDTPVEDTPVLTNLEEANVTSSDVQADTELPLKEEEMKDGGDAEEDSVIEVKGNAQTVSVSWETNEQQDREMTSAEDVTKSDCPDSSHEEEKAPPPQVVVVGESERAEDEDEMEETKGKATEETENGEAEMETSACEENECVPPEAKQDGANDGGKSQRIKKKGKRKRKAIASVETSPSKKTKLINDGYCIYVGNLNNSKFYEDIRNTLGNYLMTQSLLVQDIRLDKAKKHAFVDLASEMDLNKALTLNGAKLLDKPMKVYKAKVKTPPVEVKVKDPQKVKQAKNERSLFVENIPFSATKEDVLKVFPKATVVRFLGGTESPSKGIAFVEFQNKVQASAALKLSRKVKIQQRLLRMDSVRDKSEAKSNSKKNNTNDSPSDTLFVSNLPDKVKEKHIKTIFGNAVRINVPQCGMKSGGYAFVQFASVAEAKIALDSAKNSKIRKRRLKVQFSLKSKMEESKVSVPSKTLIVLGLDQRTTRNTLKEAFEGALSARIFVDKDTGLSRKFGFVDFESAESCGAAKESAEDILIDGCKVTAAFARPKHSGGADSGERGHDTHGNARDEGKAHEAGQPLSKKSKKVKH